MAAHPFTIQDLTPGGTFQLPPGTMLSSQFTLGVSDSLTVNIVKMGSSQDWSIRCWFSREPAGPSIELVKPILSYWNPNRIGLFFVCLHTTPEPTSQESYPTYSMRAPQPGVYYLNVLNLSNEPNAYAGTFDLVTTPELSFS